MVCSGQCPMYSMKCTCSDSGHLQVKVQCVIYTVQCAGCNVLPAKKNLAVKTGWVKFEFYLKKQIFKNQLP